MHDGMGWVVGYLSRSRAIARCTCMMHGHDREMSKVNEVGLGDFFFAGVRMGWDGMWWV